jgi:predicted chitinase
MANLLARLFGFDDTRRDSRVERPAPPILPTPDTRPVPLSPAPRSDALPPLKNWSHPFKDKGPLEDKRNPLLQLTHMAKAKAGYFPLGRSGLWHGGVHFDSGTAGLLDQSSVQCLADGEVVAYRIDTQAPTTAYFVDKQTAYLVNKHTVEKPFSRNFVLVRHRLQPPKLEGSPDTPRSLIFYSLYMHLRDWSVYRDDPTIARPAFWPESPIRRVKQTVKDVRPGNLELRGLNVRTQDRNGKVIDLLPRGAEVTVSGEGSYRKLENSLGPAKLINADGSLAGYLAASLLQPVSGNEYRITSSQEWVNVRADPSVTNPELVKLPVGTVVRVSGEGEFRKLERVNQYVHFDSLEGAQEPLAADRVVVLDTPVPIKAGALIGHLGKYQDGGADHPEEKLHLEVFSNDDVHLFIEDSRAWAKHLPDKDRTWLKLAKGTAVVPHQENVTAAQLKVLSAASPLSAADLLVPKSVLEALPADRKIQVTASDSRKASNWYRLDGLLHDADNHLLKGWVCEDVGVTPWLSPWSWEGYDLIFDYSTPKHLMASFLSAVDGFTEEQRERFRPLADKDDKGPMKSRLYEVIDRNRDGKMTAEELQAALRLPAHAQAISQLIIRKESEWFHQAQKWDALDELLGHSGSTPHLNWLAEKQRIQQMCWWGEVAEKVGLPSWGKVFHFHPVGLTHWFKASDRKITVELLEKVTGKSGNWFTGRGGGRTFLNEFESKYPLIYKYDKYEFVAHLNDALERYEITTPHQQAHFVSQCFHESAAFETTVEFASGEQYDPGRHVNAIASGNTEVGDGPKYKGKGLIQLTWKNNYASYSNYRGVDFVGAPNLIAENMFNAIDVSCWYWRRNGAVSRKHNARGDINVLINNEPGNVDLVTLAVNGGNNGLHERVKIYEAIRKEWGLT